MFKLLISSYSRWRSLVLALCRFTCTQLTHTHTKIHTGWQFNHHPTGKCVGNQNHAQHTNTNLFHTRTFAEQTKFTFQLHKHSINQSTKDQLQRMCNNTRITLRQHNPSVQMNKWDACEKAFFYVGRPGPLPIPSRWLGGWILIIAFRVFKTNMSQQIVYFVVGIVWKFKRKRIMDSNTTKSSVIYLLMSRFFSAPRSTLLIRNERALSMKQKPSTVQQTSSGWRDSHELLFWWMY